MRIFSILLALILFPLALSAQERTNTILILDGSGSMWGQIDGINKIVIAREVVGNILHDIPPEQILGLTVYGHREKGNCADIETVVSPAAGTINAIQNAVNSISPKGKTPMTDAVIAAAEALRFTEEKATVVLVSDGIETCHPDPCQAARILEETGVDFTAHVVGFDVTDPLALEQMQCLAKETGGTFTTASNAEELSTALAAVTIEPDPVSQSVRFVAVYKVGGAELSDQIDWKVRLGGDASEDGTGPGFSLALNAGDFEVRGIRIEDGVEAMADFQVATDTEETGLRVEVIFPVPEPEPIISAVTFTARIGTEDGRIITDPILWSVSSDAGLAIEDEPGNPMKKDLLEGSHVVTAYWTVQEVSGERQFIVTASAREIVIVFEKPKETATVDAPATAVAGSTIEVSWNGPEQERDYVGIGKVDAEGAQQWENFIQVRDGSPGKLLVPMGPGDYVITYFMGAGREALGSASITVTPAIATITAPADGVAGSNIELAWSGPDYTDDYIGIGKIGAEGSAQWEKYSFTRDGTPLKLSMPTEPGEYVITYIARQDRTPLATTTITVTGVTASITAPNSAAVGATIEVVWTGPDYDDDFVGIGKAGSKGADQWNNYTFTRDGSPLELVVPTEPGDYVITYILRQGREALATQAITVIETLASVSAPKTAIAGSSIEVNWTGPDYKDDYIGIGKAGSKGAKQWENFAYTRDGNTLKIAVPSEPGDYEISYFVRQDRLELATVKITVTAATASVTAPEIGVAGSTIEVAWDGPNYAGDYIGVGKVGSEGSDQWENFTYTSKGSPVKLVLPTTPGDYEISYFVRQDRLELASVKITIGKASTSVIAPEIAVAGSTIEVVWNGPNYTGDYIGIGRVGAERSDQWENLSYTADGSPLALIVPIEPGDYLVTYFTNQDRTAMASTTLLVTEVSAEISAPNTAVAGATIEVIWHGPDYDNDYVGIGEVGAKGSKQWANFKYTRDGDGLQITVPPEVGEYVITYFVAQGRVPLATSTISVTEARAKITAPATATTGETIQVAWTGPDYDNDYVGIGLEGRTGSAQWETFRYTRDGNPAELTLPNEPGEYVIRYFMNQKRTELTSVKITLE